MEAVVVMPTVSGEPEAPAVPAVPISLSTGSKAASADESSTGTGTSSPPPLPAERQLHGQQDGQRGKSDAMSDPPDAGNGAPEDARGADQKLRRRDASQPQIGGTAATETAAQRAPRPRDDNGSSFMQRRAARPQSAPLNNIHRRPLSAAGGGGGARRHRPGSAQSVVRYKVVRPCDMRQGCELWTRKLATLPPGLVVTTRGAKADVSGTARVFCVAPRRGWVSLKGIDGFGLLQRVTDKQQTKSLHSSVEAEDTHVPLGGDRGGVPSPQLQEKDAIRSLGRPHSAMARRRATEDRGEVGRPRQRPSSAHAALQRHGTAQQTLQHQLAVAEQDSSEETEQQKTIDGVEEAEPTARTVDAAALHQARVSATIRRPHDHAEWVLHASSPSSVGKAGGVTRRPWERSRWFDRAESRAVVGTQPALRRREQHRQQQQQQQQQQQKKKQQYRRQAQSHEDSNAEGSSQPAEPVATAVAVVAAERSGSSIVGTRPGSAKPKRRPASAKPEPTANANTATAATVATVQRRGGRGARPKSAPMRRTVRIPSASLGPRSPGTSDKNTGDRKKSSLPSSPERTRLKQLQARSSLLQQQSMEQLQMDQELASLVQQQEESLESLAPWGGGQTYGSPGSPTRNKSSGWRGVVS